MGFFRQRFIGDYRLEMALERVFLIFCQKSSDS